MMFSSVVKSEIEGLASKGDPSLLRTANLCEFTQTNIAPELIRRYASFCVFVCMLLCQ